MKVKCLNNGKIFNSIKDGAKWANVNCDAMYKCIQGRTEYAGKNPDTGELLQWERIGEPHKGAKSVICVNTGKIFPSISSAARWGNTYPSSINLCLKGKIHTTGKDPETNEPLVWEYADTLVAKETVPTKVYNKFELINKQKNFYNSEFIERNIEEVRIVKIFTYDGDLGYCQLEFDNNRERTWRFIINKDFSELVDKKYFPKIKTINFMCKMVNHKDDKWILAEYKDLIAFRNPADRTTTIYPIWYWENRIGNRFNGIRIVNMNN